MKRRFLLGTLFAFLALPAAMVAQEEQEYQAGNLVQIMTFEVAPSQVGEFEASMAKIVEAAKQANLSENYAWSVWNKGFTYALVYPIANMAYFDDEMQWMREFAGTPGQATLTEAFTAMESVDAKVTTSEVLEGSLDWMHMPEGADPNSFASAEVFDVWLKPGQGTIAKFGELTKEYMSFFGELGYPYMIMGNKVRFGDVGRMEFVTLFDNTENYHGVNDMEKMIDAKGMRAKWDELGGRFVQLIERTESSFYTMKPDLTYMPETSATETGSN